MSGPIIHANKPVKRPPATAPLRSRRSILATTPNNAPNTSEMIRCGIHPVDGLGGRDRRRLSGVSTHISCSITPETNPATRPARSPAYNVCPTLCSLLSRKVFECRLMRIRFRFTSSIESWAPGHAFFGARRYDPTPRATETRRMAPRHHLREAGFESLSWRLATYEGAFRERFFPAFGLKGAFESTDRHRRRFPEPYRISPGAFR